MNWLMSEEDFLDGIHNYDTYVDNGLISKSNAELLFIYAGTENNDEPDCPFCGANDNNHYLLGKNLWKCKNCLNKFSITSGRYIDNTKLDLSYWFRFCWLVGNMKITNSSAIARDLQITQKSAWLMVDTFKQALKDSGIEIKNAAFGFKSYFEVMKLLMKAKQKESTKE